MKYLKNGSIFFLFSIIGVLSPISAFAESSIELTPENGVYNSDFDIKVVRNFDEVDSVKAYEFEILYNDSLTPDGYKVLDSNCESVVIKKESIITIACFAEPGTVLAGESDIIEILFSPEGNSEGELQIINANFGEDIKVQTNTGNYRFDQIEAVVIGSTQTTESSMVSTAVDVLQENYLQILVVLVIILIVAILYNVLQRKDRYPSQMKLFSIMLVLITVFGVGSLGYLLKEESLDTRSLADEETEAVGNDIELTEYEIFVNDYIGWKESGIYMKRSDLNNDNKIDLYDYEILTNGE